MSIDGKRLNNITYQLKRAERKRENLDVGDAFNILESLLIDGELYWVIEEYIKQSDELETLHAAYGNAQKEISDLKNHNDILIKQVKRLERRSGKLGKDLLKCKNELRNPSPDKDDWKQFNKANRSGKNE